MTKYIITKNKIKGTVLAPETDRLKKQYPVKFRLRDSDDNTYFTGRMTESCNEFSPVDEVGDGYGCTEIQVWENNQWKTV